MSRSAGFNDASEVVGREPTSEIQLTLDYCSLTNGSAPCTASPPTALKCYNTYNTCQDVANYAASTKNYTFVDEKAKPEPGTGSTIKYPCLTRIDMAPTKITPSKGLGQVAKLTATLADFVTGDIDTDKYVDDRDYIAREQGTYFGKLLARNPYFEGRPILAKFRYGSDYISQNFIIDKLERNKKGDVQITGKDPLKLTEGLKSQCPVATDGTLQSAITGTPSTFSVASGDETQYGTSGYVRIEDEIIKYTRSGTTFTVVTRGTWNTTSADHDAGEVIQECAVWESVDLDDIFYDLLVDYAGIDSSYIPTTDWQSEFDTWLANFVLSNIVSEPTDVRELLDQLLIETGTNIWWDAVAEEIKLKADVPRLPGDPEILQFDDDDVIIKSIDIKADAKQRISQYWFYCNRKSYIDDETKPANYEDLVIRANLNSEGSNEYGSKSIRKVFCRWVTESGGGQTASRYRARFLQPPYVLTMYLDPKDSDLEVGQHFIMQSNAMQAVDGSPATIEFDTTAIDFDWKKQQIRVDALQFRYFIDERGAVVNDNGAADYTSASAAEKLKAYVCDSTTFQMSNGDEPYTII